MTLEKPTVFDEEDLHNDDFLDDYEDDDFSDMEEADEED